MADVATVLRGLRCSVLGLRRAVTTAAFTALVGMTAFTVVSAPPAVQAPRSLDMSSNTLHQMMVENRCSVTGFNRHVIPSHAIIRTPDGDIDLVSFDQGWQVFSGEAAGQLVAVCLGPDQIPGRDSAPLPAAPMTE